MNEIIKLTAQTIGGEPQQTVNARELHEALIFCELCIWDGT